jgi:hypothetical protein
MQHFKLSQLQEHNNRLSRDIESRQVFKICYVCAKGFCKRKGRGKASPIANVPGRFVCQKCVAALADGEVNEKVKMIQ